MSASASATAGSVSAMITPRCPDGELAGVSQYVVAACLAHICGDLEVGRPRVTKVQDHQREVMTVDRGGVGGCPGEEPVVAEVVRVGPLPPGNCISQVISLDV